MTDEQYKAIEDRLKKSFGTTLDNQVKIDKFIRHCESEYWEHTHVNVRSVHAMVHDLVKEVKQLRQQVSRLEEQVGR